jgi:hypothetical protein
MQHGLDDNPFAGLAEGLVSSVQLQWGVGVIVVGALLIVGAAFWIPQGEMNAGKADAA